MKKKYIKFNSFFFSGLVWLMLLTSGGICAQTFSDNATNYGGSWTNGSNQGSGFGTWSLSAGASSGSFIGSPANNGMGTSGIGTTAFGMFASGNGYFNAYRSINNGIQIGDTFSFYWAINFDAGGGSKGFDLRSGGTTIFNVNNGNSSTITTSNGTANANYGTSPMLITITRTSASAYSFSMTSRSGGATYTTTINSASTIDGFNIYIGNQNDGDGQKNMYVNGFSITKPITIANGNWNNTSTWLNNTIPPSGASVTIEHNVTVDTAITLRSMVINTGKTLTASDATPRTISIADSGFITNNGTFTAGNGTIAFAGSATISGTIIFNNVTLAGGVNFGTGSTINTTLTINSGGSVNTNAPTYNSSATLRYNSGGTYGRSTEWSATTGLGYPHHVQISGNTTLNVHNGQDTQRQIAGNLTIDSGSTFTTSSMNVFGQPIGVIIIGNVINNGVFTLSTSADRVRCVNFNNNAGATTTLSTTAGGDLELTGNLIDNATFNANTRAVFFTGTGTQDISGSGTFAIDYMVVNKASGSVRLLNNLLCEGPNGGNAISLTNATDILDLNGFTATFGMATVASSFSGNGFIKGGGNSSISLLGTGSMGVLRIDNSTPGTTNVLNNLTINRTSSGNILLGNSLIVNNLTLTSGTLNLGEFTINRATSGGTLTLAAGTTLLIGSTNTLPSNYATHTINATSTVEYNGTNQVIAPINNGLSYGNLVLSGTGNKTFGGNVIAQNLNNGSNATTTVSSDQNVTVKGSLINNGSFTIQNNANLLQEGTSNNNTGSITVQRNSSSLMRLDYTLWSSPVASQNLLSFSPLTVASRFYVYNPSTNVYNSVIPSTTNFATGKGYLIRMPDNHPTTPTFWNGQFSGLPNNGDVTLSVASETYNAVGNPYPSTIDANLFIEDNNLTEALYFWRETNNAPGSAYITYTLAGGANPEEPNDQVIQVGQGFIAKSPSTQLVFNNAMRVANNENQFFRAANTEHNRVRLGITGPNGFEQKILINYMTGATNDLDSAIDGKYINDSETAFYTLLNEEAYVIQGRALPFDVNDIVPLGFKTTQDGNYQIGLVSAGGLFAQNEQDIFLKDIDANIIHDFSEGNYSFSSQSGVFNNRFELVYQSALSLNNPLQSAIMVVSKDKIIEINSKNETIDVVKVFDIRGRMITQHQGVASTSFSVDLTSVASQILILQVKTLSGEIITRKITN